MNCPIGKSVGKWIGGCQALRQNGEGPLTGREFLLRGDENTLKLGSSDGCTTVKIPKTTDLHTLKE